MTSYEIEKYVDRIYKFALSKTFSADEADDLSQEILFQALAGLPKLKDDSKFEPWLWRLAANCALSFRRNKGKERAIYIYDAPENEFAQPQINGNDDEELYELLRRKIAFLSRIYREVIILYYYDCLSIKEISHRLAVAEGTVTWRLSEARKKLKKECQIMNETALRPQKMALSIYGSGEYDGKAKPFPNQFIDDALSQNILYYCYGKPQDIEGLAKLCGVPAYYIEDRMDNLKKRNAVIEKSKGKFQTEFIIWTDKYGEFCEKNAPQYLAPVSDKLTNALEKLFEHADKLPIYRADKSADELHYLYGVMAFDRISKVFSNIEYPKIPHNYDGSDWRYIANMETGRFRRINIGHQICTPTRDTSYSHHSYWLKGLKDRNMMCSEYVLACESLLDPKVNCPETYIANAVQEGYIIRKDGKLFVTPPAFTKEQKAEFDSIVDNIFEPISSDYIACVEKFILEYKKLFPKHLADDAQRMCQNMVLGFFEVIADICAEKSILARPNEKWICDVLVQINER